MIRTVRLVLFRVILSGSPEPLEPAEPLEPDEPLELVEGSGTLTLPPTQLTPGKFYIVIQNHGTARLTLKYRVYQMPK